MALELEVWQAPIVDNEGNIQPGAQVTVFNSDDTIAAIYDDLNRTPRSNPFNVGSDALARFYAEPGRYRVQAQVGSDIAVFDDVDLSQKALRDDLESDLPGKGAALIRRGVISVDSIQELGGFPESAMRTDLQIDVKGYLPGSNAGGGSLRWRPDLPKSRHDGVLFFSLTVPVFTGSDTQDYRNGVGETDAGGSGVLELVRGEIIYGTTVDAEEFGGWQKAVDDLGNIAVSGPDRIRIEVSNVSAGLVLRSHDYSHLEIFSGSEITISEWNGGDSLVDCRYAKSPLWNALINCNKLVGYGLDLRNCSSGNGSAGKGVRNCIGPAIRVSASRFEAPGGVFTGSGTVGMAAFIHNAQVTQNGVLSGDGMDLSGATGENSLYLSRNAEYHGNETDFSGSAGNAVHCRRNSRFNVANSVFDDVAGIALIVRQGATGAAQDSTGTGMMGGCIDVLGATLHATYCNFSAGPGNTSTAVEFRGGHLGIDGSQFGENFGALIEARGAGTITASSIVCTGTGSSGIEGWDEVKLSMPNCQLTNLGGHGISLVGGASASVRSGTVSGSGSGQDLRINQGSYISASGTTTTNGAGSPNTSDTNLSSFGFNEIAGNRGVIWV